MKRAILAALAALLLLTSQAVAAPPSDTATLSVTVEASCVWPGFPPNTVPHGCLHFVSEPDPAQSGPNRHVVRVLILADWACHGELPPPDPITCVAQSSVREIDKDGNASYPFRTGEMDDTGLPYSEAFVAWVATRGDPLTPISPVVMGPLP